MKVKYYILFFTCFFLFAACNAQSALSDKVVNANAPQPTNDNDLPYDSLSKVIHIMVALCDNEYQGIVPVPERLGNGQDPTSNLYWGAAYGVKTFFRKSKNWKLLKTTPVDSIKLERLIFKHHKQNVYLVADAYDGKYIKDCTLDLLNSSAGRLKDTTTIDGKILGLNAYAQLLCYVGHDGLMDFQLNETFTSVDKKERDVMILACYSKRYFGSYLDQAHVNPIVWTSNLMAPEAYVIHDALEAYILNSGSEAVRNKAAKAYSIYQKCSEKAAKNLLVSGW